MIELRPVEIDRHLIELTHEIRNLKFCCNVVLVLFVMMLFAVATR